MPLAYEDVGLNSMEIAQISSTTSWITVTFILLCYTWKCGQPEVTDYSETAPAYSSNILGINTGAPEDLKARLLEQLLTLYYGKVI